MMISLTLSLAVLMMIFGLWVCMQSTSSRLGPALAIIGAAVLLAWMISPAKAHDPDHPELDQWYASVKQPDSGFSCCGLSDAYHCKEGATGSQVTCTINDSRDNKKLGRRPVPNGTVINIPQHKINKDPNPTGHAVVWLSPTDYVFCFVGISGS